MSPSDALPEPLPHALPATPPAPEAPPEAPPVADDNAPPADWDARAPAFDDRAGDLADAPTDWPKVKHCTLPALDCEGAVLGAILLQPARYWECHGEGLRESHFASELHARLWTTIGDMLQAGLEVTGMSLTPQFAGDGQFLAVGGHVYLGRLMLTAAGIRDVRGYARTVRDWADRRRIAELAGHVEAEALHGQSALDELCGEMEAAIAECRLDSRDDAVKSMARAAANAQATHDRAAERGAVDGLPFGLAALDNVTGGAGKSDLVILAGRPGMGKSALAMHVALHNARAGHGVVLFSLEMSAEQFASRAIAQATGLSADKLRRGDMNAAQREAAHRATDALDIPLTIDDRGGLTVSDIRSRLKRLLAQSPIGLVLIDYVQLLQGEGRADNRVQELTAITAGLKRLAKEFDLPVIALSQLSRAVELRDNRRPQLADLRDSGSIEQDADTVVFLYRDHYYLQRAEPRNRTDDSYFDWLDRLNEKASQAELIVAKNRHGPCQTALVGFDGALTRFYDRDDAR